MPAQPLNDAQHKANLKRFAALDKNLTARNRHVDQRLTNQDNLLKVIDAKVGQLLTAVTGEEEFGTTGLVKRVADLDGRVDKIEGRSIFITGVIAAVSAFFSGVAAWWAGRSGSK